MLNARHWCKHFLNVKQNEERMSQVHNTNYYLYFRVVAAAGAPHTRVFICNRRCAMTGFDIGNWWLMGTQTDEVWMLLRHIMNGHDDWWRQHAKCSWFVHISLVNKYIHFYRGIRQPMIKWHGIIVEIWRYGQFVINAAQSSSTIGLSLVHNCGLQVNLMAVNK